MALVILSYLVALGACLIVAAVTDTSAIWWAVVAGPLAVLVYSGPFPGWAPPRGRGPAPRTREDVAA